ncbi:MAG: hypothetical protein ACYC09_04320 [Bacteroidota bacterium]
MNSTIDGKTIPVNKEIHQIGLWSYNRQKILTYNTAIYQYMIDGIIGMSFTQKPEMGIH